MSLREALDHARTHHPELRAARARVAGLRAEADVPGAQWLPSVSATAQLIGSTVNNSTTTMLANTGVDVPRIGATEIRSRPEFVPYPSTFLGVGVRQQLFDFGRVAAQTAARDAEVDVERQRAGAVRIAVTADVIEAYFAVRAAHYVLAAAEGARTRFRVHLQAARAAVETGLRPPIDLARLQVSLAHFEAGYVRAEGSVRAAQGVFAAVVGVAEPLLDAARSPRSGPPPQLRAAEAAVQTSPALREARARVHQARAEADAEKALLRPDVYLTATASARAGGASPAAGDEAVAGGWAPEVPNYHLGVVLRWPIYEPLVRARARAAQAWVDARRAEVDASRLRLLARVRQAHADVEVAYASLVPLEKQLEAARETQMHAQARFLEGLGTALDLADAEALLTEAEIQLAVARFQVGRARATLERITGRVSL